MSFDIQRATSLKVYISVRTCKKVGEVRSSKLHNLMKVPYN